MITVEDLKVDMRVSVRGGFGGERPKIGIINEVECDGKNGRATIDYTEVETGEERWAYIDQIVKIIK